MTDRTLEETSRRIEAAEWLELRCFELLGGWVPSTPEPDVKLVFARQSHHHAWHAELFERVRPTANGFAAPTSPPVPPGWVTFFDELAACSTTDDRVAGTFGVLLPAKLGEYEQWRDHIDPVRDAPLLRWLRFVIADEADDLGEGRELLTARGDAPPTPGRVALATSLARAGPLLHGAG